MLGRVPLGTLSLGALLEFQLVDLVALSFENLAVQVYCGALRLVTENLVHDG